MERENALTLVKYVLKYPDGILMFEDYFQMCVYRCVCVCVCVRVEKERERGEENFNVSSGC